MSGMVVTAPEEPSPQAKSFPARVAGVFISPGSTFADIARRPDFLAPLIVGILAALAVSETMLGKIGMERIIRASLEQSGRASSMNAEQLEQAVRQGAGIGSVIAHVVGLLAVPIYVLFIAGVGLLILNLIFGASSRFKTVFSVACYTNLVGTLGALLAIVIILFGDPEQFNPENFAPTNAGFFLHPSEVSRAVYILASSFDIFTVWYLIVLAIGLSAVTGRKVKPAPIFLTYLGLWTIWVLGKVGWAMIMK